VPVELDLELIQPHMAQKRILRVTTEIFPGIPSDIIDTRDTTGIIDTTGTFGVFHPAPFGVVEILDAFDIRDRKTSKWSSTPRHRHCSAAARA